MEWWGSLFTIQIFSSVKMFIKIHLKIWWRLTKWLNATKKFVRESDLQKYSHGINVDIVIVAHKRTEACKNLQFLQWHLMLQVQRFTKDTSDNCNNLKQKQKQNVWYWWLILLFVKVAQLTLILTMIGNLHPILSFHIYSGYMPCSLLYDIWTFHYNGLTWYTLDKSILNTVTFFKTKYIDKIIL